MAQTTRTRARMCLFETCSHGCPFSGQPPSKKHQLWGVNRRFQAKIVKSKNVHIIKTTASIPTVIKTTKCHSWVVPTHALVIQGGGQEPSWKNRKIGIYRQRFEWSPLNLAWWRSSTLWTRPTVKNPRWRPPPSWIEKSPYLKKFLAMFCAISMKFDTMTEFDPVNRPEG